VRLGCVGVGLTTYPGSDKTLEIYEEVREIVREAKAHGLAVILWSYVRGGDISKKGETAIDTISYGAHMACLMGAHIVKCKIPSDVIEQDKNKAVIKEEGIATATKADRVAHVVKSCFDGRRMVIFSGGAAKDKESVLDDARAIVEGGGNGSIIGRNAFQRPKAEGIDLLQSMMDVYAGE
jgi:class I fructose-bisphosphate aldolase